MGASTEYVVGMQQQQRRLLEALIVDNRDLDRLEDWS
jgi:hypothetical protein